MVDLEVSEWWAKRLKEYESSPNLKENPDPDRHHVSERYGTTSVGRSFSRLCTLKRTKNPAIQKALKESPTHNRKGFYMRSSARHLEGKLPENKIAMFMTQYMGGLIHYASLSPPARRKYVLRAFLKIRPMSSN